MKNTFRKNIQDYKTSIYLLTSKHFGLLTL